MFRRFYSVNYIANTNLEERIELRQVEKYLQKWILTLNQFVTNTGSPQKNIQNTEIQYLSKYVLTETWLTCNEKQFKDSLNKSSRPIENFYCRIFDNFEVSIQQSKITQGALHQTWWFFSAQQKIFHTITIIITQH